MTPKDGTLTGITTPSQSRAESNGNEGVFHTLQVPRIGASQTDTVLCHTKDNPSEEFSGDTVGEFKIPPTGVINFRVHA